MARRQAGRNRPAQDVKPLQKPPPKDPHWIVLTCQRSEEILQVQRKLLPPISYVGLCIGYTFIFSVLIIDFNLWLQLMFESHLLPSIIEMGVPSGPLAMTLPENLAVWFQEATTVVDSVGCHRYFQPYARFGSKVISFFIFSTWIFAINRDCRSWTMSFVYLCMTVFVFCQVYRCWDRTHEQYFKMLAELREKVPLDKIMRAETMKVLDVFEDYVHIPNGSNVRSLQHKIIHTEILKQGAPYCIDVLNDFLDKVTRGSPEAIQQGVQGDTPIPLYVQWQRLNVVMKAAENAMSLRTSDDSLFVTGKSREILKVGYKKATSRQKHFEGIVKRSLGSSAPTEFVEALVEADRRHSRKNSPAWFQRNPTHSRLEDDDAPDTSTQFQDRNQADCLQSSAAAPPQALAQSMDRGAERETSQHCPETTTPSSDLPTHSAEDVELDHEPLECVCCFAQPATIVFTKCGHLTYCKTCRRKNLKCERGSEWIIAQSYSKMLRARMKCPICRQESTTTLKEKFAGKVFS